VHRVGRRGLVATVVCVAALCAAAAAAAQVQPPAGPSLRVQTALLRQVDDDLRFELRLSRAVRVSAIEPGKRFACLVLGPSVPARRRVCVVRRGARLHATISAIGPDGRARGPAPLLRRARVRVSGRLLIVLSPARSMRVRLGAAVSWQALLTWRDGGPCEQAPGPQPCSQTVPAAGVRVLRTRAPRSPAFARAGHLRLLATGDSMIQIVDSFLEQRLESRRGTSVRSDARISTGLSKPFALDWVKRAREQAQSLHPDVTVMFIGANDGFAMRTAAGASVACCGAGWVAEYARRVASMMRSYLRGGRSYVYWMTLPAPRPNSFARVYRAVNAAIRRAGRRVGGGARVIDLVPVFTPGGRFRQHVSFRDRTVDARQADGIHLSVAGASIAATLLIDRLRADRALPPG